MEKFQGFYVVKTHLIEVEIDQVGVLNKTFPRVRTSIENLSIMAHTLL